MPASVSNGLFASGLISQKGASTVESSFTVNDEYVEVEVYKETTVKGSVVFLVKVKFLEIGLYVNSIRVQESPKFPEKGLWVQLPVSKVGYRYFNVIECDGASPFLEMITRHSRKAVEDWLEKKAFPKIDDKDESNSRTDWDTIPF